jgi:hypothetical protein
MPEIGKKFLKVLRFFCTQKPLPDGRGSVARCYYRTARVSKRYFCVGHFGGIVVGKIFACTVQQENDKPAYPVTKVSAPGERAGLVAIPREG